MNHPPFSRTGVSPAMVLLTAALLTLPLSATAQPEALAAAPVTDTGVVETVQLESSATTRLQHGDATHGLLAMQREGDLASRTPRPLAGDVASLSYQRYLDSFKHPIPEKFTTTVSKSGSGSSGR